MVVYLWFILVAGPLDPRDIWILSTLSTRLLRPWVLKSRCLLSTLNAYWDLGREGGNVLINDAFNTFYLRLYGVGNIVKDYAAREKPAAAALCFTLPINSKGYYYMHHVTGRTVHTTAFVIPVVKHWLELEIARREHHEGSIRRLIAQ